MTIARLLLSFLLLLLVSAAPASPLESPRLLALQRNLGQGDRAGALARFWKEVAKAGTPMIEPVPGKPDAMRVTFLAKGPIDAERIDLGVFAVFNRVPWTSGDPFEHLPGSDVWFRSYVLPAAMRSPYQLIGSRTAVPGLAWQRAWEGEDADGHPRSYDLLLDPLNPRTVDDVYFLPHSRDNIFAGPAAPPERWLRGDAPLNGRLTTLTVPSRILGNRRTVLVYMPPIRPGAKTAPGMLLLFDGLSYRNPGMVPEMLDRMIAAGAIPPMAAVMVDFIDGKQRQVELAANDRFSDFIGTELVPMLRRRFGLSTDPARSIVAGASRGGLAASYMALRYPSLFGNVIGQSSALWWAPTPAGMGKDWLLQRYESAPKLPVRFYLEAGSLEDPVDMRGTNRRFADALRAKGYTVCHGEYLGGHTFLHWRANLPQALITLSKPVNGGDICPASAPERTDSN